MSASRAGQAADSFADAVIMCHGKNGATVRRVLLPSGRAFVANERDGEWEVGRATLALPARMQLFSELGALYGLPTRLLADQADEQEAPSPERGPAQEITVAMPDGQHSVYVYAAEASAFERIMAACERLFHAVTPAPAAEREVRAVYQELERWSQTLPDDDTRRTLVASWVKGRESGFPFLATAH